MFVKKDIRKIPKILDEARKKASEPSVGDDPSLLTELRLSRRPAEFDGSLSVLCSRANAPALRHLVSLSMYDCEIKTLDGIGLLGSPIEESDGSDGPVSRVCPNLRELNVGRNPIRNLPNELSTLSQSLTTLWCDDCEIQGSIPSCVLEMRYLEVLRTSNNSLTTIPESLGEKLMLLKVLCLDGNKIVSVPESLAKLKNLESLMLRQNLVQSLPEGVPGVGMKSLTLLHVSSNKLKVLPKSLSKCHSLEKIYANGNVLEEIPAGIGTELLNLKTLNLSTNKISQLPADFVERFGEPIIETGICEKVCFLFGILSHCTMQAYGFYLPFITFLLF